MLILELQKELPIEEISILRKMSDHEDEYEESALFYSGLEKITGLTRKVLQPLMISLRDKKYVELCPGIDEDLRACGSGWILTEKGRKLFYKYIEE